MNELHSEYAKNAVRSSPERELLPFISIDKELVENKPGPDVRWPTLAEQRLAMRHFV